MSGQAVDIGVRVVRGPDWNFDNQDGGDGHLGTVIDICKDEDNEYYPAQTVVVAWDNGEKNVYRAGLEKQYDLRLYDNAGIGVKHEVNCSVCGLQTVPGILWRSNNDKDFVMCSPCYMDDKGDIGDRFKRLDYADHDGEDVPVRRTSRQIMALGLFEKAKVSRGPDWRWENQDGGANKTGEIIAIVNFSPDTDHDAAEVMWENGYANVYRLGFKGHLDVKCIQPSSGGRYYRDHLPILKIDMKTELSSDPITPAKSTPASTSVEASPQESKSGDRSGSRFKAGDCVRIEIDIDILKMMEQSRGSWNDRMVECIGLTGTVISVRGSDITVDFNSAGKWTFLDQVLNEVKEFVPGQVVKVGDSLAIVQKQQEERVGWNDRMALVVGKKGRVEAIDEDGDVQLSFGDYTWTFAPDCLTGVDGEPDYVHDTDGEVVPTSAPQLVQDEITISSVLGSIMIGDVEGVKAMLTKEPQMMLMSEDEDKTPLHIASNCGNLEIVEFLCQKNVPLDSVDNGGSTALLVAADKEHLNVMKLLIEKQADKNAKNKNDETAAYLMVKKRNKDGLRLLCTLGCNINIKDSLSQSPLYEAINSNDEDLLSIILDWPNLEVSSKDKMGFSPFCFACKKGNFYAVKKLLIKGADVNDTRDSTGHTGLHLAVYNNRKDIVEYLLKMPKVNKDCRTNEGQSALHIATKEGFFEIMKLLVKFHLDINGMDNRGNTCLHLCVMRKDNDEDMPNDSLVKYLIKNGVDVNCRNKEEKTAYDVAPEALKTILEPLMARQEEDPVSPRSLPNSSPGLHEDFEAPVSLPVNPAVPMCVDCEEERCAFLFIPCSHGICKGCKGQKPKKKCPDCKRPVQEEKAL